MSLSFADGIKWLENKANKLEKIVGEKYFKREGYRGGIMGPIPAVDAINNSDIDFANTKSMTNNLAQGIDRFNLSNNALNDATQAYLGATANYGSNKNYNVFINKPTDFSEIKSTPNENISCVANSSYGGLNDASTQGFDLAYPINPTSKTNFPNAEAAANACKIWAADTQVTGASSTLSASSPSDIAPVSSDKTYFAVTKDDTNSHYKCYTGALTGTPSQYSVKQTAYVLANSSDADSGGLFLDGTIGVYNSNPPTTPADPSNPRNGVYINTALTGYGSCDKWVGGSINPGTIKASLGVNCTNITIKPVNVRYIQILSSGNNDGYIQINKLKVFAIVNGVSRNIGAGAGINNRLLNLGSATSGRGTKPGENATNRGWAWLPAWFAIVDWGPTHYPYEYHSPTPDPNEWWQLDLGQEFLVYQVDYYNRGDCCQYRAQGMKMIFLDGKKNTIDVKNPDTGSSTPYLSFKDGSAVQKFMVSAP